MWLCPLERAPPKPGSVAHKDGSKSGGRQAGTQNKSSRELKAFLDKVFAQAFADPAFEAELLTRIKSFTLSDKVLLRLLEYWAGAPQKSVAHTHEVSLAKLIAGVAAAELEDDEAA